MKTVKELRLKIEDLEKRICSTSNTKLRPELAELVAEITALNCSLNFDDKNIKWVKLKSPSFQQRTSIEDKKKEWKEIFNKL